MIGNFTYHTPTKLYFGKGCVKDLPGVVGQYGKNVLLTYGGGSIKKMGLYDKVKEKYNVKLEPEVKFAGEMSEVEKEIWNEFLNA